MEFDEIILSITEGLTGEKDKDKDYLLEKMEEYKDPNTKRKSLKLV